MKEKLQELYSQLKSLGLEKFATPLMEVYDFEKTFDGQTLRRFDDQPRFKKELEEDFDKYQEYSQKIIDNFSVIYPSFLFQKLYFRYFNDRETLIFANADDLESKFLERKPDLWHSDLKLGGVYEAEILRDAIKAIKNTSKYDYNIIVLSNAIQGDNYSPEWFLHDILGHTISLVTKQLQYSTDLTFDFINILTGKFLYYNGKDLSRKSYNGLKTEQYIERHKDILKTIDFKKYSKDNAVSNELAEKFISCIQTSLQISHQAILLILEEMCFAKNNLKKLLQDIGSPEQSDIIPGSAPKGSLIYEDIIPSIFAAYIADRSGTKKIIENYIKESFADLLTAAEDSTIIAIVKEHFDRAIDQMNSDIYRVVKQLMPKYIDNPIEGYDIFLTQTIKSLLKTINIQELIKIYVAEISEAYPIERRLSLIEEKLTYVDKTLSVLEGAYVICNMTSF